MMNRYDFNIIDKRIILNSQLRLIMKSSNNTNKQRKNLSSTFKIALIISNKTVNVTFLILFLRNVSIITINHSFIVLIKIIRRTCRYIICFCFLSRILTNIKRYD